MKCYMAKKNEVQRDWRLVDADGQILGRLATRIAMTLMGKTKPVYTPYVDTGDFVVVVNAEKVQVSGRKAQTKVYQRYSHYPGGRKVISYEDVKAKKPEMIIREAVRRMLPKNKLGRQMLKKLKIYSGPEHKHAAQQPQAMEL